MSVSSLNSAKPSLREVCWSLVVLGGVKRPWGQILTAALSVSGPVILGAAFGQFYLGLIASLGGLAGLYLRQTCVRHRLVSTFFISVGLCICFCLGALATKNVGLQLAVLALVTGLASFVARIYKMPPPGSFFFIMVACAGFTLPLAPDAFWLSMGLVLVGGAWACALVLVYSLWQKLRQTLPKRTPPVLKEARLFACGLEALTLAFFLTLSYAFALWLGFEQPYWAPVSCIAILQGVNFRTLWQRKLHRVLGTVVGMGAAWLLFFWGPGAWSLAFMMFGLIFIIETLITRNYGWAVVFMTPLTMILAEGDAMSTVNTSLMLSRFVDVLVGGAVGYVGAWVLTHQAHYEALEQKLKRLIN